MAKATHVGHSVWWCALSVRLNKKNISADMNRGLRFIEILEQQPDHSMTSYEMARALGTNFAPRAPYDAKKYIKAHSLDLDIISAPIKMPRSHSVKYTLTKRDGSPLMEKKSQVMVETKRTRLVLDKARNTYIEVLETITKPGLAVQGALI